MVRSKHLDFLQQSQRYVKQNNNSFIYPYEDDDVQKHFETSLALYDKLLSKGAKKEDARFVLPEATCTELVVTGNFQAWLDFLELRSGKEVQWEIRAVANEIKSVLAKECPNIFKDTE